MILLFFFIMLIIPDYYQTYNILSVDPGLNRTGVSCYTLNQNNEVLSIESQTLFSERLRDDVITDEEYYAERVIKLQKLRHAFHYLIRTTQARVIVCESPFYNRFRPMAYGALLEVLSMIQMSILDINVNIPFRTVEPLLVKKTIGAGMMKGKIDVKHCIGNNSLIMSVLRNSLDMLDEHAIDSIAVGYTFLKLQGVLK